ncbi:HeH/LEM domain-containing protein [Pseudomonas viridiflava]|uniref:HeH/LEM domain-containing protein n=1 Tax=Pseudomonas viridiflava TaxID=33069 RepID=UPI0031F8493B
MSKNIWYLSGPFHQYKEDVKALAKERGLRIIDASATEDREDAARDVPEVTIKESPKVLIVGVHDSTNIEVIRAELELVGLIVESFADQELVRPEGELGPVAERLFQVFEAVNAGVQGLIDDRDSEFKKAEALQVELDALKREAVTEPRDSLTIPEIKEQLDAKDIKYTSTANKAELLDLLKAQPANQE